MGDNFWCRASDTFGGRASTSGGSAVVRGENNPRSPFIEVVTLSGWRSDYGPSGTADVFIDVRFDTGRVGGDGAPVRFQLSLRQAHVHIHRDAANVLEFPANGVTRTDPIIVDVTTTSDASAEADAEVSIGVSSKGASGKVGASAKAAIKGEQKTKLVEKRPALTADHTKTESGWSFKITPAFGERLAGIPWNADERRLVVKDPRHQSRTGEPPEPRIEIRCRREDLIIEKIEFKDRKANLFNNLAREKQVAVEQYIKSELAALGFDVGEPSDPYTVLVLADAALEIVSAEAEEPTAGKPKRRT